MEIPNGSHFCCLALNGPRLQKKEEYQLGPGLFVSNKQDALELEPHWVEWLGTIQADSFRESSLYITVVIDSRSRPSNEIPLPQSLDNRVRLFHHALVLLGCGYNDAMLMVGGEKHHGGGMHVGPIRPGLTPCFKPFYRKHRAIEPGDLEKATKILTSLELMYTTCRTASIGDYVRASMYGFAESRKAKSGRKDFMLSCAQRKRSSNARSLRRPRKT